MDLLQHIRDHDGRYSVVAPGESTPKKVKVGLSANKVMVTDPCSSTRRMHRRTNLPPCDYYSNFEEMAL